MQDLNYTLDDVSGRELEYLEVVNQGKSDFRMEQIRERRRKQKRLG